MAQTFPNGILVQDAAVGHRHPRPAKDHPIRLRQYGVRNDRHRHSFCNETLSSGKPFNEEYKGDSTTPTVGPVPQRSLL